MEPRLTFSTTSRQCTHLFTSTERSHPQEFFSLPKCSPITTHHIWQNSLRGKSTVSSPTDCRTGHTSSKDVFAELSCAGCEAAQVLVLKQRISNLRDRVEALEKRAHKEKIKQNKFVLRELVKEARRRILEVNGIPQPSSKQSWKYCLHNLTAQQLQHANVNVKLWPELVELLSPSAAKLNDWVHGYTTWQAARVIGGMTPTVQATWAELFKVTHKGATFEHYAAMEEPTMAKELQQED